MRFLLGVLVGYTVRGKHKLLIKVLVTLLIVYVVLSAVVLPAIALLALRLDVQRERRSRPAQTKVPVVKGLTYEDAERKLHAANLNIRLLATRYDSALQPGLIIDQTEGKYRQCVDLLKKHGAESKTHTPFTAYTTPEGGAYHTFFCPRISIARDRDVLEERLMRDAIRLQYEFCLSCQPGHTRISWTC